MHYVYGQVYVLQNRLVVRCNDKVGVQLYVVCLRVLFVTGNVLLLLYSSVLAVTVLLLSSAVKLGVFTIITKRHYCQIENKTMRVCLKSEKLSFGDVLRISFTSTVFRLLEVFADI